MHKGFFSLRVCLILTMRERGEGSGTALQYSCLENPMDGGAWWAAVHGAAKRIHVPNTLGSYEILLFTASVFTSITSHIHNWALFLLCLCLFILLELFPHSSSVAYWASTKLASSSLSVIYFCLFILFMGFSRQEYWSGLPSPSPVDHVLSELSTMIRLSWVVLHGMTHSFIELDDAVAHVISLICFMWLWFSFYEG